ncbi:MAG: valine--tRNA ligase [Bacilli bacterium]
MLDLKYNHQQVEAEKYDFWLSKDLFKSGDETKEPYCIVIPPPNVTGKLHLGHAWNTTLQDILIRYKKLKGYDVLWLPGMDHAGIATQAKIDQKLKEQGIKPRAMKREDWLKIAWEWKKEYTENIHLQWKKMGLSLDYSKERFTLDQGLSSAVNKVFIDLYNQGLIYRGERIINWDPEAMTALSNEEVIYKDVEGAFYHLKYYLEDKSTYLEIATTRPETLFGDTAVAVNPQDKRYQHLIGKKVVLPIVNKLIPIIEDEHADMEFGTGVVKITPAHDPNDFEVGNRHNLERIKVINPDGTMNENALIYNGLDRFDCRKKLMEDLTNQDLVVKVEKRNHSVGHSERTNAMVEPYLSKQWFVKMRPLADKVLDNQKDNDTKVNFVPKRFEKIMNHWMTITHDWCISRQLWWGHRIPAWYKGEEVYVGLEEPKGEGWQQDEDVLDTWFSSALWPFSTLGWPENNDLINRYYPNNVLVTAYDIIPFWVNRMTFQGLHFLNKRPFKDCLIHGLIRDKDGRKMSKSLGNGVDPIDVIEKYGTDALRLFITTNSALGQDLRYDEEKVKSSWNFINKLWNASRFTLMNIQNENETNDKIKLADEWIISKLNKTIISVQKNMEKYEFGLVGSELNEFIWNDFCDWYIEISKSNTSDKKVLITVLKDILKMLHPFIPFVTEEIYQALPNKKYSSIMLEPYPEYQKDVINKTAEENMEKIMTSIKKVRTAILENKIPRNASYIYDMQNVDAKYQTDFQTIVRHLIVLDNKNLPSEGTSIEKVNISTLIGNFDIFYHVDKTEEINNLNKSIENIKKSIEKRKKLLSNQNYLKKAPVNIVDIDRKKLKQDEEILTKLESNYFDLTFDLKK